MIQVLNLGAGVQSSTILLMAIAGELPRPDHCIFADTGWEPFEVYEWLRWLEVIASTHGIPVHRVSGGNLRDHMLERARAKRRGEWAPMFSQGSPIRRGCTRTFKILPIQRKVKELLGLRARGHWPRQVAVRTWLGISYDEASRMKADDAKLPWQTFWHPLIEREDGTGFRDQPMTRADCYDWLRLHDYPMPPRSACIGCPYHSNEEWRHIRTRPKEWSDAIAFDHAMRVHGPISGMKAHVYLHRSCVPLHEAPIDEPTGDSRYEECEGMCGT